MKKYISFFPTNSIYIYIYIYGKFTRKRIIATVSLYEQLLGLPFVWSITSLANRLHYAFETGLDEYGSVSSGRDNGFVWRTFTDASFHFRMGPTRQGHSRRSSALRRVRSLSLSVNLKSNYTRLRSQAVTQFVVIPGVSISAILSKLKLLKTLTAFHKLIPLVMQIDNDRYIV